MTTATALEQDVLKTYLHTDTDGVQRLQFMVEGVHCAACMARIEGAMNHVDGVDQARLNLSTKRLTLTWKGPLAIAEQAITAANKAGYGLTPYDPASLERKADADERFLLKCLAVAGFASMNVMLLSVSLWSGAEGETRTLFQWISALIVLPALAYAGRPYFYAAYKGIKHKRLGMEVPISVALVLTSAISLYDTIAGYGETYFESAIMLLFFLLIGRYLEARVKGKSRNAAEHLLGLQHTFVAVQGKDGKVTLMQSAEVPLGSIVLWRQGERLGVDGVLESESASVDTSVLTGESLPRSVRQNEAVQAGLVNRGASVTVKTTAVGQGTVLAELARLVDNATTVKNAYTRLADRISRSYAPLVHTLALGTFTVCMLLGIGGHESVLRAAAVLIVTCPCALALAVPTVQVALMGRMLRSGIILKSGEALEKLATITHVILDKTGTLTLGKPRLVDGGSEAQRKLAARMAIHSQHPLSVAIAHHGEVVTPLPDVEEVAGKGLKAVYKGETLLLGSAKLCGVKEPKDMPDVPRVWFVQGDKAPVMFVFDDPLRADAAAAVEALRRLDINVQVLSGDRAETVQKVSAEVGIHGFEGEATPQRKQEVLATMARQGCVTMMVGDGLNDAPSLALAPVGVSFGQASDLAKLSADVILQRENLMALPLLVQLAQKAKRAVWQNVYISLAYNVVTIPLAMMGYITPMYAALAMSASSLMVVTNAALVGRGKDMGA
ncbi:MAG: cadmium-translocating P-type ATPase [Blastochloris viridis]|uniref:Cadmium-translocating P-type ATPase n=1 Tax=Blastochloris viridis TaxID=1079 RepID=A0A6N4R4E6_BLAVI|nr:MAG: cadmium-translocating P-type ATPase [Blastochloris viridis]